MIDTISFPNEYRNLLESILGTVLLLDEVTPDTIVMLGNDWVGVTRQGIVVNRYSMGYPQAAQLAPELNLRRLLAEAQDALLGKEQALSSVSKELEGMTAQESAQKEIVRTKTSALDEVQTRLREVQAHAQELADLRGRQEARRAAIAGELAPLSAEKDRLAGELDELSGQKTVLEKSISDLIAQEASIRLELKEQEQKREALWQLVLESRSAESQAGDRHTSAKRQLEWISEQQSKLGRSEQVAGGRGNPSHSRSRKSRCRTGWTATDYQGEISRAG